MTKQITNLSQLEKLIGHHFSDQALLKQALVHRSSLNEYSHQFKNSNETFEFLGDAVLELWTSNLIFKKFPSYKEGELTNLRSLIVRTENLAEAAISIKLGEFLYLSRGEDAHLGRANISILADSFEALIGAIYLDDDMKAVDHFLSKILMDSVEKLSVKEEYKDSKSLFQEIAQKNNNFTPNYQVISESGPDHEKIFEVGVYIKNKLITTGKGNSKQKAENDAATNAIKQFKNK
jgi:ribonuclease-3